MSEHLDPPVAGLAIAGATLLSLLGVATMTFPVSDAQANADVSTAIYASARPEVTPDSGLSPTALGTVAGATVLWLGGALFMSNRRG